MAKVGVTSYIQGFYNYDDTLYYIDRFHRVEASEEDAFGESGVVVVVEEL